LPQEQPDERRLASAVGTNDAQRRAFRDRQINMFQDQLVAVGKVHMPDFDQRLVTWIRYRITHCFVYVLPLISYKSFDNSLAQAGHGQVAALQRPVRASHSGPGTSFAQFAVGTGDLGFAAVV
jgi:hypothetical protein